MWILFWGYSSKNSNIIKGFLIYLGGLWLKMWVEERLAIAVKAEDSQFRHHYSFSFFFFLLVITVLQSWVFQWLYFPTSVTTEYIITQSQQSIKYLEVNYICLLLACFPKENVDILWVIFSVHKVYILQALACIIDKMGEKEEQILKRIHVI